MNISNEINCFLELLLTDLVGGHNIPSPLDLIRSALLVTNTSQRQAIFVRTLSWVCKNQFFERAFSEMTAMTCPSCNEAPSNFDAYPTFQSEMNKDHSYGDHLLSQFSI